MPNFTPSTAEVETAFLRTFYFQAAPSQIICRGLAYTVELEAPLAEALSLLEAKEEAIKVVCSLQTLKTGNRIAVCRLHRDYLSRARNNEVGEGK